MTTATTTSDNQIRQLAKLVADWAIKRDANVKGLYTSGDFVAWQLSQIFTPAGWSFTILSGPEMITLSDKSAYVRVVGRLEVTFADGTTAHQDDIGIWPLMATNVRQGGTLETTAAERYETVEKAARTDCLKNAARNLGTCFAPLSDRELAEQIRREAYRQANGTTKQSAAESIDDLFGSENGPVVSEVEAFIRELRDVLESHPRAGDPAPAGTRKSVATTLERAIGEGNAPTLLRAVYGCEWEELTVGMVAVLTNAAADRNGRFAEMAKALLEE